MCANESVFTSRYFTSGTRLHHGTRTTFSMFALCICYNQVSRPYGMPMQWFVVSPSSRSTVLVHFVATIGYATRAKGTRGYRPHRPRLKTPYPCPDRRFCSAGHSLPRLIPCFRRPQSPWVDSSTPALSRRAESCKGAAAACDIIFGSCGQEET